MWILCKVWRISLIICIFIFQKILHMIRSPKLFALKHAFFQWKQRFFLYPIMIVFFLNHIHIVYSKIYFIGIFFGIKSFFFFFFNKIILFPLTKCFLRKPIHYLIYITGKRFKRSIFFHIIISKKINCQTV